MALRTDYQDDVFSGQRKYIMTDNGDNTVSFTDVTSYSQVGDNYGAALVNSQNEMINNFSSAIVVSNTDIPIAERTAGKLYFFYS